MYIFSKKLVYIFSLNMTIMIVYIFPTYDATITILSLQLTCIELIIPLAILESLPATLVTPCLTPSFISARSGPVL